jgi:hypothetical protein
MIPTIVLTMERLEESRFGRNLLDILWLLIVDVIIIQSTTNLVRDQHNDTVDTAIEFVPPY